MTTAHNSLSTSLFSLYNIKVTSAITTNNNNVTYAINAHNPILYDMTILEISKMTVDLNVDYEEVFNM